MGNWHISISNLHVSCLLNNRGGFKCTPLNEKCKALAEEKIRFAEKTYLMTLQISPGRGSLLDISTKHINKSDRMIVNNSLNVDNDFQTLVHTTGLMEEKFTVNFFT